MKVFLSADMEGTCGIVSWPETERATPFDYSPMQKQMSREVAAACRGALAAGAEEVLVKDAHDSARNICRGVGKTRRRDYQDDISLGRRLEDRRLMLSFM